MHSGEETALTAIIIATSTEHKKHKNRRKAKNLFNFNFFEFGACLSPVSN